jgi:ribonuclease PH
MQRSYNRLYNQVRPLRVTYGVFPYADGSVLFEMGGTKVFVSVTMQSSVPQFLRGKKCGWLTAEYALLPASTLVRHTRETQTGKQGRSVEIARLIGRVFRSVCKLEHFGERTITIDCDVLQADGSTRTACINGAYLALRMAELKWLRQMLITSPFVSEDLIALSVGIVRDELLLDLDYQEDVIADADFTFVVTRLGKVVEIQGTAERKPCAWQAYEEAYACALQGVQQIGSFFDKHRAHEIISADPEVYFPIKQQTPSGLL